MKNEKSKIIKGVVWSYAERLLAQIVSLVVSIVLARLIEPDAFGTIAIVTVFITICDSLTIGGFGNALVQKKDSDSSDFSSICWLSVGMAVILYLILFMAAKPIEEFYKMEGLSKVTKVMGLRVIISAFNSIQQAYVQKNMEFKKFFYATLGGTIASAFIGIAMAYAGFGIWALVAQYMSSSIIGTVVLFIVIDWKPSFMISIKSIKELWGYGIKILLSTITYTIKDSVRSLIIGKRYSSSDLAYYNQGQKYPSLLMSDIVDSIGKVLFPFLSEKQDNKDDVKKYMRKSISASAFILCPILVGLIALTDTFVIALLTEKWEDCIIYMRILCLVYLFRPLSAVFQKSLLAIGKSAINLVHELLTTIITLVLIAVCTFRFDSIPLIAWSYVVVSFIGTSFFAVFTKKEFKYNYFEMVKDFMPSLFVSVIMGVAVVLVGILRINVFMKLIVQVLVGAIVYITLAIILRLEPMKMVINMLRKRK